MDTSLNNTHVTQNCKQTYFFFMHILQITPILNCIFVLLSYSITLHDLLLVRRFYSKRLTYSILWTIPTGAIWVEVSQGHNDMLTAVGFEPVPP